MTQSKDRMAEWIRNDPHICCLQETHLKTEDLHRLKVKGWKPVFQANGQEKTYKGGLVKLAADLSTEKLQVRSEWQEIFQVMRTRGLQPRLLYPAKLSI